MKPIIFNAIDKLYNEKTGMIYPVSAAVGGSPTPAHNITIDQIQLIADQNVACFNRPWNCNVKFDFEEAEPEMWQATIQFDSHVCSATCDYTDPHDTGIYSMPFSDGETKPEQYDGWYMTYDPAWLIGGEPTSATITIYVDGEVYAQQTSTNIFIQPLVELINVENIIASETESHEYDFSFEITPSIDVPTFDFSNLPTNWFGEVTFYDAQIQDYKRICIFNSDDVSSSAAISMTTSFENIPTDQTNVQIDIYQSNRVKLYQGGGDITMNPYVAEPLEVSNVVFHYDVEGDYKTNWSLTADITVNDIPEGWYGSFAFSDSEETYVGNVFTTANIVDGTLTITDLMPNYDPISPVHFAILSDESDAYNYYYDPESPFVPTEGEMYAEVEASSTNVQNNL